MAKNRILTSYYRFKPGGLCKRLSRGMLALAKSGHDVHYLSITPFPVTHSNIYFHRFYWPPFWQETAVFWLCFHILAPIQLLVITYQNKITLCFSFSVTYAALMQPVRVLLGVPLVVFLRADSVQNRVIKGQSWLLVGFERLIEAVAIWRATVLAVSKSLAKDVQGRHKVLLPNSVDVFPNDIPDRKIQIRRMKVNEVVLGCVGILEPRKNQEIAIAGLERTKRCDFRLLIFGIGPDETHLKQLIASKGLEDQASLLGWVEEEKVWNEIDVLLMPSLHEGAPNAVLEALARRVPVIASDIPEHREILPSRYLVSSTDVGAWSAAIIDLSDCDNQPLNQIIEEQAHFADRLRFDWDSHFVDKVISSAEFA